MVNILAWDEFQKAAEELYQLSPNNTRYVAKYRHTEGKLVLKVTDDRTCLKYKTDQMQDLNKFERLNRSLMAKMHNRIPVAVQEAPVVSPSAPLSASTPVASSTISSPAMQQGGGGKAKKNRRK
ncbi:hypothetical protein BGZ83_005408 [Gryganskiella cystojenkinii]|nr:hypothetical protein BGZ83_005408 [Gryganskiella cystojenkinii]